MNRVGSAWEVLLKNKKKRRNSLRGLRLFALRRMSYES